MRILKIPLAFIRGPVYSNTNREKSKKVLLPQQLVKVNCHGLVAQKRLVTRLFLFPSVKVSS